MTPDIRYFPAHIVGKYAEAFATAPGKLTSQVLKGNPVIKMARFMVNTSGNITFKDLQGNSVTLAVTAGVEYTFPVSEISSIPGPIVIFHDGEIVENYTS